MRSVVSCLKEFGEDYLFLDGRVPTLTLGMIQEEFILYNIPTRLYPVILKDFKTIADKEVSSEFIIAHLSHGQRLILSSLIALCSNAQNILFYNFFTSVSERNQQLIFDRIEIAAKQGKTIKIIDRP